MRAANGSGPGLLPLSLLLMLSLPRLPVAATPTESGAGAEAEADPEAEAELKLPQPPKLDRAQSRKLLLEVNCGQRCDSVSWQVRLSGERQWRAAQWRAHSGYRDTFYVSGLQPGRRYQVRALLAASPRARPYAGEDVPLLDVTTCPERPQAVRNLTLHAAGPGWLELRWEPPPKEACSSHVSYEVRYGPVPAVRFPQWRQYGYYRSDGWIYFRPTHPCAAWPRLFCLLLTDAVQPGERHRVEVRTTRFDESPPMFSHGVTVMAEADTTCISTASCGVIGSADAPATSPTLIFPSSAGGANGTTPTPTNTTTTKAQPGLTTTSPKTHKPVNSTTRNDANVTTIKPAATTSKVTSKPTTTASVRSRLTTEAAAAGERDDVGEEVTGAPEPEAEGGCWNGSEAAGAGRTQAQARPGPAPASALQHAAPLLVFLLVLACAGLPVAYFLGRRFAQRAAAAGADQRSSWKRGATAAETEPVLADDEDAEDEGGPGESGRVSWGWLRAQEA